ncbi:MAG TPA: hypothetical protein VFV99_06155, partial [Kofleriaceae bacterium]|nr:hypothetical protein [Kofleriaceae bacterium]
TNDVYVTGTRGTILHWTGSQMVDESIPPSVTVTSIWGVNGNDLWAVAQTGLIYRKMNNGIWIQQTSPTTQFLWQIWGTAADDIWAVGDGATVIHYDGTQWSTVSVPIASTVSLRGIAPVPGGGLRAVGTSGTVLAHP